MKETFKEYHPLNTDALLKIWDGATFIFDTNVLFNLYRYSTNTSNEIIETLDELKDRIWIPFQVGLEFNKKRLTVISDQKKNYTDFEKKITSLISDIEDKNRNPFFSKELTDDIIGIKKNINSEVLQKVKDYELVLKNDPILEKINSIFENKIGDEFNSDDIKKCKKEGEIRYKDDIPPGYCDKKKPENDRYGDLIIWKQIIKKSKESKTDIIFILDDRKKDWWLEHEGRTISARPELLKEFRTESGQNIHFYKPFQFLEYSNNFREKKIAKDVIQEVKYYIPIDLETENLININYQLEGDWESFNRLIKEMEDSGYSIFYRSNERKTVHNLQVSLPNIPDLKRRLDSKFISKSSDFNLVLLNDNSKSPRLGIV